MPFSKELIITKIDVISCNQATGVTIEGVPLWKDEMKQTSQDSIFEEGV